MPDSLVDDSLCQWTIKSIPRGVRRLATEEAKRRHMTVAAWMSEQLPIAVTAGSSRSEREVSNDGLLAHLSHVLDLVVQTQSIQTDSDEEKSIKLTIIQVIARNLKNI